MKDFTFTLMGMEWTAKGVGDENIFADEHHGLCSPRDLTIFYHNKDAKDQQKNTVIHESLHCIEKTLDLDLSEADICGLAAGIHELIQQDDWLKRVK